MWPGQACWDRNPPPLWTESQTRVKTLPCRSFVAGGKNNRSNDNKMQAQRMGSVPIFYISINVTIDTMLKVWRKRWYLRQVWTVLYTIDVKSLYFRTPFKKILLFTTFCISLLQRTGICTIRIRNMTSSLRFGKERTSPTSLTRKSWRYGVSLNRNLKLFQPFTS